ncbi:MAG: HAD-IB family phosphatase [Peptococcaceae bacterium]|nr:HAD-IB family phosphatase [Peptococcaceae bacterium]
MKLAIFDFDGTLFPKDTLPFLLSQRKDLHCSRFTTYKLYLSLIPLFLKYKLEILTKLSREQMKVLAVKKFNYIFKGMSEPELITFFSGCSEKAQDLLNKSVVQEVERARAEGFHTVLLSGTYDYLLAEVGKSLHFDTVIGTKMHFTNGRFDPDVDLEIVIGEMKLKRVYQAFENQEINWEESRAYADGFSDLDLLLAVGSPIAVRPDAKLRALAEEKKWRIIS